ncbi:hypothetical protein [Nonomuraea sp. SYSU D8015]|uniref:hypothetical protein n=1 Tax=Nonomuraea sp. SYSU D8015 TaxID=2593644 RepID=UPI0016608BE0|nr:hypothetical protein [Nonomuraea sp. SYSU D8015]
MTRAEMPPTTIIDKQTIKLLGGRSVEIVAYSNGEFAIRVDDAPFVIAEFRGGEQGGDAAVRLSPGRQGSTVHGNWHRDRQVKLNGT